jgi:acyl-CoA thioesterase-1
MCIIQTYRLCAVVLLSAAVHASAGADAPDVIQPQEVEYRVELVGRSPFPFQPVRLAAVVKNVSVRRLPRFVQPDSFADHPQVQGPFDDGFRSIPGSVSPVEPGSPGKTWTSIGFKNSLARPTLDPGDRVITTFALVASWSHGSGLPHPDGVAVFPEPGKYRIRFTYSVNNRLGDERREEVTVDVPEPTGDDAAVYRLLRRDRALAAAVMSSVSSPTVEQVVGLQSILSRYPSSSYAPYAKFALARSHLQGIGVVSARKLRDADWEAAYRILNDLKEVEFCYQPAVYAALYRCAKRVRPEAVAGIRIALVGGFSDAEEALDAVASDIGPENWASFRVRDGSLDPVADEPGLPRVLLVGDDVSVGYTHWLRRSLKGKANLHRIPESGGSTADALARPLVGTKAAAGDGSGPQAPPAPATKPDAWLGDKKWDVIVFNFGLDDLRRTVGRPRTTVEQYEKNLRVIAARLKAAGATLVWVTTTPVPDGAPAAYRPTDVAAYNTVAAKLADELGLAVVDLHAVVAEKLKQAKPGDLFRVNDVRPTLDGGRMMGELIAKEVEKRLAERR